MKKKEAATRKELMATMAEMGHHLPNVCPEKQELVAQFMVEQLRGAVIRTEPFGFRPFVEVSGELELNNNDHPHEKQQRNFNSPA